MKRKKREKKENKKIDAEEKIDVEKREKRESEKTDVDNKLPDNKLSDKYLKQTKIAVVIMIVLIVSILLANWIVQRNEKFEYNGMEFNREKEDSIVFYKSLLGFVSYSGEEIPFILKLRNDPRELSKIPVEGEIKEIKNEAVFSLSPGISTCPDTIRTMIDFSMTLKAFGINASAATTDKNYSKENKVPLVGCKDAKQKTVIVMEEGNETRIIQNKSCYTIEIKDCEIQKSFEKFVLDYITNSMAKA